SCGFGLIASLDDQPSHGLVRTAMTSLNRLTHRGAIAGDGKTGDGCGLLLKRPEAFLRAAAARESIAAQIARQGLELAGWRVVPVNPEACGTQALKTLPHIEQVFVNCRVADRDEASFNRRLFMARRLAEQALQSDPAFYVPSLSASTLVYKGM